MHCNRMADRSRPGNLSPSGVDLVKFAHMSLISRGPDTIREDRA